MSDSLDVIVVDDDPAVCKVTSKIIERFYTWGDVVPFTNSDEAITHCLEKGTGVAVFVLDVFLGGKTGFSFLDAVSVKFPMAYEDTIIITGKASEDVVNMCIASDINHLLEKPVRPYALQLAVRAVVMKYIKFAKRVLQDPALAENVAGL